MGTVCEAYGQDALRRTIVILVCGFAAGAAGVIQSAADAESGTLAQLCTAPLAISRVEVTRSGSGPGGQRAYAFPVHVTVASRADATAVASAICALPRLSGGLHCPADFTLSYTIRFNSSGTRVGLVRLDPFGCQTVAGAGSVRWAARSPALWRTLGRAIGVPNATVVTFQGRS